MNIKKAPLTLGDFIRSHRMGEEMSQVEFAEFLGISKQRLCDLEKDRSPVSLRFCKDLAAKLDLPVEWLAKLVLQDMIDREGIKLKVS